MKHSITLFALAFLIAVIGCGDRATEPSEDEVETPEAITAWPATRKTDLGNFIVTVQPIDGGIERNTHFSLGIKIEQPAGPDSDGKFEVKVDADMPSHRHGMNTKPEIVANADRSYRVDGMLFHMGGDWVITVDITGNGKSEKAAFPVFIE